MFAARVTCAILGKLHPDVFGEILGTGYSRIQSRIGIHGLARAKGSRVDFLAVMAKTPGTRQFRKFIAGRQAAYQEIHVWEDWNPLVGKALSKYGFSRARMGEDGPLSVYAIVTGGDTDR